MSTIDFIAQKSLEYTAGIIRKSSSAVDFIRGIKPLTQDVVELSTKIKPYKSIDIPKFNPQDIVRLNGLEGDAFVLESQKIIGKSMGIPEELLPRIVSLDEIPAHVGAQYDFTIHQIELPDNFRLLKKEYLFERLAHEMKHVQQQLTLLRSDKLAEKAIERSTKFGERGFFACLNENRIDGFFQRTLNNKQDWVNFREKVVSLMGKLPENQTKKIEPFLADTQKNLKYYLSKKEIDAYLYGNFAFAEYIKALKKHQF